MQLKEPDEYQCLVCDWRGPECHTCPNCGNGSWLKIDEDVKHVKKPKKDK